MRRACGAGVVVAVVLAAGCGESTAQEARRVCGARGVQSVDADSSAFRCAPAPAATRDPCAPLPGNPLFSEADDINGDGHVSDDEAAQRIGKPRC